MTPATALRPRTVSEIVDAALTLARLRYGAYVAITAVIYAPSLLLAQALYASAHPAPGRVGWSAIGIEWIVGALASGLAQGLVVAAMSSDFLGEHAALGVALGRARARLGTLVVAMVARLAVVIVGLVLLVVPGLYAIVRYACVDCVAVLGEPDEGGIAALRRAWSLSRDQETQIFLVYLLVGVILAVLSGMAQLLVRWSAGMSMIAPFTRAEELVLNVFALVLFPIYPAIQTVLYYDLRVRNEGFDVEMLSRALDGAPDGAPAAG